MDKDIPVIDETVEPIKKSALQQEWDDMLVCRYGRHPDEINADIEKIREERGGAYANYIRHELFQPR